MAAYATLSIPLVLGAPANAATARQIFDETPGATNIEVDASRNAARLAYQFPGNLDVLVRKLLKRGLLASRTIGISVPMKNIAGGDVDYEKFLDKMHESPAIHNARFEQDALVADIVPTTAAVRFLYEETLQAGLMALDHPTVAHPQEFVL